MWGTSVRATCGAFILNCLLVPRITVLATNIADYGGLGEFAALSKVSRMKRYRIQARHRKVQRFASGSGSFAR